MRRLPSSPLRPLEEEPDRRVVAVGARGQRQRRQVVHVLAARRRAARGWWPGPAAGARGRADPRPAEPARRAPSRRCPGTAAPTTRGASCPATAPGSEPRGMSTPVASATRSAQAARLDVREVASTPPGRPVRQLVGDLEREPGLADAAGTDERHQGLVDQAASDDRQVLGPADDGARPPRAGGRGGRRRGGAPVEPGAWRVPGGRPGGSGPPAPATRPVGPGRARRRAAPGARR